MIINFNILFVPRCLQYEVNKREGENRQNTTADKRGQRPDACGLSLPY